MIKESLIVFVFLTCSCFFGLKAQYSSGFRNLYTNNKERSQDHTALMNKVDTSKVEQSALSYNLKDLKLGLNPAFEFLGGFESSENAFINRNGIGVDFSANYRNWNASLTYLYFEGEYLNYQKRFIGNKKIVPGMNASSGGNRIHSDFVDAFINYQAGKYFNFEMGYGRNFIGDGYRSMLLSDFGNASPYLKIKTKFWKVQYTNIFAAQENIFNVEGNASWYKRKYTATHYLDWKATDWLSIGLFESIVWAADEGDYDRGPDVNYLNPVIFYRPVEFSVGSSDNALVGANLKLTPIKNHKFYFQLLFDEFLLDELRADIKQWRNPDQNIRSGWWANKYGIQAGWESTDIFNAKGLKTRLEFNLARPYTYAHSNPTQAYSHYNMSLAHPLGANFHELVLQLAYQKERWRIGFQYNNSLRGVSPLGTNFGENLELSNTSREKEYENYIAQGRRSRVEYVDAQLSYLLKKEWKCTASIGYLWREETHGDLFYNDRMIYIRFRTNLFNQYFDF